MTGSGKHGIPPINMVIFAGDGQYGMENILNFWRLYSSFGESKQNGRRKFMAFPIEMVIFAPWLCKRLPEGIHTLYIHMYMWIPK